MGHTISRKSIKKIITILTAAILVLLPVGGSIREVHAEGEESSDSGMSLEHEKMYFVKCFSQKSERKIPNLRNRIFPYISRKHFHMIVVQSVA